MYTFITLKTEGRRAELKINKPPFNVLDIAMMEEINAALDEIKKNEKNLNVVLITAEGEKAFSAGVDVADHTADKVDRMIEVFHGIFRRLESLEVVTVAGVKGAALGGGCELAIGCDLVVAADNAKFGQPEIKLAVFPPIALVYLASSAGTRRAMEIVLMGENITAADAKTMGLVNQVFPLSEFDGALDGYLKKFESMSGSALASTKKAFKKALGFGFENRLKETETLYMNELMKLHDAHEGLTSFLEKRKAVWAHK